MSKIFRLFLLFFLFAPLSILAQSSNFFLFDVTNKSLTNETIDLDRWNYFFERTLPPDQRWAGQSELVLLQEVVQKITYGTFALRIKIDSSLRNSVLAVEVPSVFSSYRLFENGRSIGSKGKIGTTKESSIPSVESTVYYFTPGADTIELILHVNNFYKGPGGIKGNLRLGASTLFEQKLHEAKMFDYALFIALFLMGISALCFYYVRFEHRNVFLFLSCFSLSWLLRCLFGYHYRILEWMDISWEWVMRIEYVSMMLTTFFAICFLASLFPEDFKKKVKYIALSVLALFVLSILVLPPSEFISAIVIYLGFSTIILMYVLTVIAKAFAESRGGSTMMLLTMFFGSVAFGYAIVCYLAFFEINMVIFNCSFILLGIMLSFSVSIRLSRMDYLAEKSVLTLEHFFPGDKK